MSAKSRVSTSKKPGFKLKWWMGLGLVALVALVGVVVIRFSNASGLTYSADQISTLPGFYTYSSLNNSPAPSIINDTTGKFPAKVWAFVTATGVPSKGIGFDLQLFPGNYTICAWGRNISGPSRMTTNVTVHKSDGFHDNLGGGDLSRSNDYSSSICNNFSTIGADSAKYGISQNSTSWNEIYKITITTR